jgi:hypothetical protein
MVLAFVWAVKGAVLPLTQGSVYLSVVLHRPRHDSGSAGGYRT